MNDPDPQNPRKRSASTISDSLDSMNRKPPARPTASTEKVGRTIPDGAGKALGGYGSKVPSEYASVASDEDNSVAQPPSETSAHEAFVKADSKLNENPSSNTSEANNNKHGRHSKAEENVSNNDSLSNTMNNTTSDQMVEQLRRAHQKKYGSIVEKLSDHADLAVEILEDEKIAITREIVGELLNIANTNGHFPRKGREALERMRLKPGERDLVKVNNAFHRLSTSAKEVDFKLHGLARLGQESQGGTITGAVSITEGGKSAREDYKKQLGSRKQLAGDKSILDGPRQSIAMFDGEGALSVKTLKLGKTDKEWLQTISRKFGTWLARGKIVYKGNKKDNEKAEWQKNLKEGIDYLRAELKDPSKISDKDNKYSYCPSMIALEDPGCQPAFEAMLSSINPPKYRPEQPFSPPKYPEEENQIRKGTNRSARFVDYVLKKPGQYQLVMIDSAIELPIAIKPVFRKGQTPEELEKECENQVMGHLAQYIMECFEFKAQGAPSFATGVIGTPAYIKVIQLHLVNNTATGKFDLEHKTSQYLPLIAKKDFEKWWSNHDGAWKERKKKQYKKLVSNLYGDADEGMIEGIPKGYLALWKMKTESRSSFFGPPWKDMFEVDENSIGEPGFAVGEVLGHGAFCLVIEAKGNNPKGDYVFKTSAWSSDRHLSNERDVLKGLKQDRDSGKPKPFLSILEKELQLTLRLGSLKESVYALLLSPKGVPLINYLHTGGHMVNVKTRSNAAKIVTNRMEEALEHMHGLDYLYNDISPNNIIAIPGHDGEFTVCLIDFGIASEIGHTPDFCNGTALYMHEDAFEAYPYGCRAMAAHDYHSLSLTVTTIVNKGYPVWSMKGFPRAKSKTNVSEMREVLRKRTGLAKRKLRTMEADIKRKLIDWLH